MTIEIRVLGPGCIRCQQLYANTVATVAELGLDAHVEKVDDVAEIAYELVMAGHVASVSRLREVLSKQPA
jgi:hypothetical protein